MRELLRIPYTAGKPQTKTCVSAAGGKACFFTLSMFTQPSSFGSGTPSKPSGGFGGFASFVFAPITKLCQRVPTCTTTRNGGR
eukprot:SAG11_NODE_2550_length_3230_cov_2.417758_2_plen_83_part_00